MNASLLLLPLLLDHVPGPEMGGRGRYPAEEERALSALDELNKSLAARSPCRINTLPLLRDFDLSVDFGEHGPGRMDNVLSVFNH